MSTDKELLELAAKAAGFISSIGQYYGPEVWNPLTNDGDALRLMIKLEIDILFYRKHVDACDNTKTQNVAREDFTSDKNASVRLAIVRAAAEIGRAMS